MTPVKTNRYLLNFRLRTFLLLCCAVGGGIAYFCNAYSVYLTEQRLIDVLAGQVHQGGWMSVNVNGKTQTLVGSFAM